MKDTDGDGRADVRRVVWTGFDASNTSQLRVSHPTFGPDLFEIRNQPKEAILLHIIIPEYEIVPGYVTP